MSFIDNAEIQTALISELKSITAITSRLGAVDDVKEDTWQGSPFKYPNVRVRIIDNVPIGNTGCLHRVRVGIQVNSEEQSSKEAEEISGIIGNRLNDACFSQSGVNIILRLTNLIPALRTDPTTWKSETLYTAIVS